MELHLDGSNVIRATRADVFARLTDPNFLASSLPDADNVKVDGDTVQARVKMRIAVVSSAMNLTMTIVEKHPPDRAKLSALGTGSGSSIRIASLFELTGENPTNMKWSADAEVTGVMSGLGSSLLKGFATKKVAEIFSGISKSIEAGGSEQGAASGTETS